MQIKSNNPNFNSGPNIGGRSPKEYTALEATDGLMGLEMIKKYKPDLVLMDIMLPEMDGMSVIEKVHEDKSLGEIPIIAITAKAMKGDEEELLKAGFDDYMSKPINVEILIKKIKNLIIT